MKNTKLNYLDDTYLFKSTATIIGTGEGPKGNYVVTNQTIFYPQGGGQPSDTGFFVIEGKKYLISFVGFQDGKVLHYGDFPDQSDVLVGKNIEQEVDSDRRICNAKLHTAGHLIAGIIDASDNGLRATKGYHFQDGSYVEFEGGMPANPEETLDGLNNRISDAINNKLKITVEEVSYDKLVARCPNIPSYLPKDKPLRIVTIDGYEPLPCGGTHVRGLDSLNKLQATKLRSKKGNVKISYSLS